MSSSPLFLFARTSTSPPPRLPFFLFHLEHVSSLRPLQAQREDVTGASWLRAFSCPQPCRVAADTVLSRWALRGEVSPLWSLSKAVLATLFQVWQLSRDVYLLMWFLGVIQRPRQDWARVRGRPCAALTGLPTASWSRSCRCGDEIVEINESPVPCMTLNEVHSVLSHCEPGPVPIIVSRHPDPQVTSLWVPLPPGSRIVSVQRLEPDTARSRTPCVC